MTSDFFLVAYHTQGLTMLFKVGEYRKLLNESVFFTQNTLKFTQMVLTKAFYVKFYVKIHRIPRPGRRWQDEQGYRRIGGPRYTLVYHFMLFKILRYVGNIYAEIGVFKSLSAATELLNQAKTAIFWRTIIYVPTKVPSKKS